jgi:hypothetical protein
VPTAQETADACSAFAACADPEWLGRADVGGLLGLAVPLLRTRVQQACLSGTFDLSYGIGAGSRVIPVAASNEGWPFFIRAVLAARGDCARVRDVLTDLEVQMNCQEDGCWGLEKEPVHCDGDVATVGSHTRDCSRSGTRCSETSLTGCTDRPLTRCKPGGHDRCDGNVKLGCDGCGFVSFRDCSWNGGTCSETADGAKCLAPGDYVGCHTPSCKGTSLSLCVSGRTVTVDCREEGMQTCYSEPPPDPLPMCPDRQQADCVVAAAHCALGNGDGGAPDAGAR